LQEPDMGGDWPAKRLYVVVDLKHCGYILMLVYSHKGTLDRHGTALTDVP
jgi:hypothetical protein